MICNNEVKKIVLTYKDRLIRFGYEIHSRYVVYVTFSDGYNLEIRFTGRISLYLENKNVNISDVYNIRSEYFEIIYKICKFSLYDFHGDVNTIPELIKNAKKYSEEESQDIYNNGYCWRYSSEGPCEYNVSAWRNRDNDKATILIWIRAYLTDKNLWYVFD